MTSLFFAGRVLEKSNDVIEKLTVRHVDAKHIKNFIKGEKGKNGIKIYKSKRGQGQKEKTIFSELFHSFF